MHGTEQSTMVWWYTVLFSKGFMKSEKFVLCRVNILNWNKTKILDTNLKINFTLTTRPNEISLSWNDKNNKIAGNKWLKLKYFFFIFKKLKKEIKMKTKKPIQNMNKNCNSI